MIRSLNNLNPRPAEELRALLMGEKQSEALKLDNDTLSLDVAAIC
jgi:hypothetical protein